MRKILVVRAGRIGDMVMCTPALSALLDHYPDAEFTLLTSDEGKQVLSQYSLRIKHIWLYYRNFPSSIFRVQKAIKRIEQAEFQSIFCFESNERYYRLFERSSAQVYGLRNTDKSKHYAQLLLDMVSQSLDKNVGAYAPSLRAGDEALKENKKWMDDLGISRDTLLIGLHPTFSGILNRRRISKYGRHKIWPSLSYAQLADRLHQYGKQKNIRIRVVMNLLPKERKIGEQIASQSLTGIDILSPEPNFDRYIAFLAQLDLFVSPDTGPMHLASALRKPLVAMFSGKDPNDCGPFGPHKRNTVICAEEMKSPLCGIASIDVESVFRACRKQIHNILRHKQAPTVETLRMDHNYAKRPEAVN